MLNADRQPQEIHKRTYPRRQMPVLWIQNGKRAAATAVGLKNLYQIPTLDRFGYRNSGPASRRGMQTVRATSRRWITRTDAIRLPISCPRHIEKISLSALT
jgi:hypothetical protein